MSEIISLSQFSRTKLRRVWRKYNDERDPTGAADITGWAIKLRVKRDLDDDDSLELVNLSATLGIDDANGVYDLQFSSALTANVGEFPGELLAWEDGVTTSVPHHRIPVTFEVVPAVDLTP